VHALCQVGQGTPLPAAPSKELNAKELDDTAMNGMNHAMKTEKRNLFSGVQELSGHAKDMPTTRASVANQASVWKSIFHVPRQSSQSRMVDEKELQDAPGGGIQSDAMLASASEDRPIVPGDQSVKLLDVDYAPTVDLESGASGSATLYDMAVAPKVVFDVSASTAKPAAHGKPSLTTPDMDGKPQVDDVDLDADTLPMGDSAVKPTVLGDQSSGLLDMGEVPKGEPESCVQVPGVSVCNPTVYGELSDAELKAIAAAEAKMQRRANRCAANSSGSRPSSTMSGTCPSQVHKMGDEFDLVQQSTNQCPNDASASGDSLASAEPLASEPGVAASEGEGAAPGQPAVEGPADRTTCCFAGRRCPKNEQKRAFFLTMQSVYFTVVKEMRDQGRSVDPELSQHKKLDLQNDFWTCVKKDVGEDSAFYDEILCAGQMWALQRFIVL
jgi:hypothetical protein